MFNRKLVNCLLGAMSGKSDYEVFWEQYLIRYELNNGLNAINGRNNGLTIKQVFEKNCPNIKADKRLAKELALFSLRFRTKNQDHINFFGGNLIGVYPIKFTITDRNTWFDTILDCDESDLTMDLHMTQWINPSWHVVGDPMNMSMCYLLHILHNSTELSASEIEEAKLDVVRIFHYKNLSSILSNDYPYPANKSTAMETYKQLSKKFDLKVAGTWKKLIDMRAKSIITKGTGIHYNTYVKMVDDKAVIYFVGDVQDRLRDVINSINNVFHTVKKKEAMIVDAKTTVELDGVKHIRDVEKTVTKYVRYIRNIVGVQQDWYRPELVGIIVKCNNSIPPEPLAETLKYISENYKFDKSGTIDEFLQETIQHLFEYVASTKGMTITNLPDVIARMRGAYKASRSTNESVLKLRALGDEIVEIATGLKTESTVSAIRVGVLLYIVARTLTMEYYAG